MNQGIIDRIQKLLALAKSPNEHEAAQATAKAQELLMQHNLSLADVTAKAQAELQPINWEELEANKKKIHWKGQLARALADANFCKVWWTKGHLNLAGKEHNQAVVKSLYAYLTATVDRLAGEALKAEKQNYQTYLDQIAGTGIAPFAEPSWRTWKSSFIAGCAERLRDRIDLQTERMQTEGIPDANVTGLVCRQAYEREQEAIALTLCQQGIRLRYRSTSSRATFRSDGYSAGKRAGDSVNLNCQVNSTAAAARLLK